MLEPSAATPSWWTTARSEAEMMRALDEIDPTYLVEVSMRGDPQTCRCVTERVLRLADQCFHLLGGFHNLQAVHYHDPDQAAADDALRICQDVLRAGAGGVSSDAEVPLGGGVLWMRSRNVVSLPWVVPETVVHAVVGGPVSRLIDSPMLPKTLLLLGMDAAGGGTTLMVEDLSA